MRIVLNHERCISSGQCCMIAPAVFDQSEDGTVLLLDASPPISEHQKVQEAALVCPHSAISLSAQDE